MTALKTLSVKLSVAMLAMAMSASPSSAAKIGKIELPDSLQIAGQSLSLNGAGTRNKLVAKLYVAGLYLTAPETDAASIIAADAASSMRIVISSSLINPKRMEKAIRAGFDKSAGAKIDVLAERIDRFIDVFRKGIEEGDVFDVVYDGKDNTMVIKNGAQQAIIQGADFKKALLGIWLGADPVQKSLKSKLLGQ